MILVSLILQWYLISRNGNLAERERKEHEVGDELCAGLELADLTQPCVGCVPPCKLQNSALRKEVIVCSRQVDVFIISTR